jgi:hypothetical protein
MKLICISASYNSPELLTINKWYEGEPDPLLMINVHTTYDPKNFPLYIVRCNDGNYRRISAEYFLTPEDWREKKLKELEI